MCGTSTSGEIQSRAGLLCVAAVSGSDIWPLELTVLISSPLWSSSRHSAVVRQFSAHPPAPPPDTRVSRAGGGVDAALSQAPHTLSQGHQELSWGGTHARSRSHHSTGWCFNYLKCQCHEVYLYYTNKRLHFGSCIVMQQCLFIIFSLFVFFQAFRRTMALSQGDVDEAVLFAKVTENIWGPLCGSSQPLCRVWPVIIFMSLIDQALQCNHWDNKCHPLIIQSNA